MAGTQGIYIGVFESILCGRRARIDLYLVYFHAGVVLVELESDWITTFGHGLEECDRGFACDIDWINSHSGRLGSTTSSLPLDYVARGPVFFLALLAPSLEHGIARDCPGGWIPLE